MKIPFKDINKCIYGSIKMSQTIAIHELFHMYGNAYIIQAIIGETIVYLKTGLLL